MMYLYQNNPKAATADKTIKNHIAEICKKSDGLLCEDDFKKDRKFLFEPPYHGLLLALLDTSVFDDRKNDRKLSTKSDINGQIARNIDKYLTEEDATYVKQSPMYLTARIEDEAFKRLNQESSAILRALYFTDAAVRWKSLKEYLDALTKVRCAIQHRACDAFAKRMIYAHGFEEREDALYQKGLFEAESLESLMIKLLAYRVNGKHKAELPRGANSTALFLVSKIFRYCRYTDDKIQELLDELDISIKNSEQYKIIKEKAEKILDLNDPYEKNIYEMLMFYSNITFLINYTKAEDYQGMQRYMESIVKYDLYDIWSMFLNYGRGNYSEEDLQEIKDIQEKYK